jgi:hypothetical protein
MIDKELISLLEPYGYRDFKSLKDGRTACLAPFIFTWAILAGLTKNGYKDRWCYESLLAASTAFADWNGEGEPSHEGLTRKV